LCDFRSLISLTNADSFDEFTFGITLHFVESIHNFFEQQSITGLLCPAIANEFSCGWKNKLRHCQTGCTRFAGASDFLRMRGVQPKVHKDQPE
jgi:hypothetical protein